MFGRRLSHAGHSHHVGHPHPLRRRVLLTILVAALLAALALLISPPHAHGNFVYWTEASPNSSIGRGKINGTGQNNNFITGLNSPVGVAVDSKFIYWTDRGANQIGRANLDGTGVKRDFITADVSNPAGIAIAPTGIYWVNNPGATSTIGHANIDGSNPVADFITTSGTGVLGVCGLAADSNFVYWSDGAVFARSTLNGSSTDPNFVTGADFSCGQAVDPSFVYWATDGGNHVGRAPVGGRSRGQQLHRSWNDERWSERRRRQLAICLLGQLRHRSHRQGQYQRQLAEPRPDSGGGRDRPA